MLKVQRWHQSASSPPHSPHTVKTTAKVPPDANGIALCASVLLCLKGGFQLSFEGFVKSLTVDQSVIALLCQSFHDRAAHGCTAII